MSIPPALRRAYLATTYRARTPSGIVAIRIGETTPALDALLAARSLETWAFVTAWNPRSRATPLADNEAAQARLRAAVAAAGWEAYVGAGVPADDRWGPEPSLLITGVAPDAAIALGRRFDQNAIVTGRRGEPARLVDCFDARSLRPRG